MPLPSTLNPDLVERLVARVDSQVPTPASLFTQEKRPFIRAGLELMLNFFPLPLDVESKSEDEILTDMATQFGRGMWSQVESIMAGPPLPGEQSEMREIIREVQTPVRNVLEGNGHRDGLFAELNRSLRPEQKARLAQQVDAFVEASRGPARQEFRLLVQRFMQNPDVASPDFLRKVLVIIGRTLNFPIFAECVVEDVVAGETAESSLVLHLLDAYIKDFIQADRKSIWFQSIENNFGYRRDEENWRRFVGEETLEYAAVDAFMTGFETILDMFHGTELGSPYPQAVLEIIDHLEWILSTPVEFLIGELPSDPPIPRYTDNQQVFQQAFVAWAIQEVQCTRPDLVDDGLLRELPGRIWMAAQLLPNIPQKNVTLTKNLEVAQIIAPRIRRAVELAQHSARNLIASRHPDGPKQELVLGIGFQGPLFSRQPNAKHQPNGLLVNVSDRGRRFPLGKERSEASVFSLPFLHATRILAQKIWKSNPSVPKAIPITVLGCPTEEDKKMHSYLFRRLLTHAFSNPDIQVHPGFLDQGARIEIRETIVKYTSGTLPDQKGLRPEAKKEAQRRVQEQAANIGRRIVEEFHSILSPEELQLLLSALSNRASICVESVISRHSKNDRIVPVSFDPRRRDIVTVDGRQMRVGPRGIIPPCDNYCQLLSGGHQLWADLTRSPTLDQLAETANEHRNAGVRPQMPTCSSS
jgi:hypothetical protein